MKREDDINLFTVRAYYILTNLETDFTELDNYLQRKFMER